MRYRVRHIKKGGLVTLLVTLLLIIAQSQGWFGSTQVKAPTSKTTEQSGPYTINHYIDGDTIAVNINGKSATVRFIGIDTPETHKPNTPVQCYGAAAATHTQATIKAAGGSVRLATDSQSDDHDRYNRLLRYVYLPNGTNLNEVNVQQGYAFYYPYFPFDKQVRFKADQEAAMTAKRGLWGACTPTPTTDGGYVMNQPAG